MPKSSRSIVWGTILAMAATGCMGHNGLGGKVRKFNLEVTRNRWGREAVYALLFPINLYVVNPLDNLIFNSIEFWGGTNPLSGESPPVVDMDASFFERRGIEEVAFAQLRRAGPVLRLHVVYKDGSDETLLATHESGHARFFHGPEMLLEVAGTPETSSSEDAVALDLE